VLFFKLSRFSFFLIQARPPRAGARTFLDFSPSFGDFVHTLRFSFPHVSPSLSFSLILSRKLLSDLLLPLSRRTRLFFSSLAGQGFLLRALFSSSGVFSFFCCYEVAFAHSLFLSTPPLFLHRLLAEHFPGRAFRAAFPFVGALLRFRQPPPLALPSRAIFFLAARGPPPPFVVSFGFDRLPSPTLFFLRSSPRRSFGGFFPPTSSELPDLEAFLRTFAPACDDFSVRK